MQFVVCSFKVVQALPADFYFEKQKIPKRIVISFSGRIIKIIVVPPDFGAFDALCLILTYKPLFYGCGSVDCYSRRSVFVRPHKPIRCAALIVLTPSTTRCKLKAQLLFLIIGLYSIYGCILTPQISFVNDFKQIFDNFLKNFSVISAIPRSICYTNIIDIRERNSSSKNRLQNTVCL